MFAEQESLVDGTVDFDLLISTVHDYVKGVLISASPSDQDKLLPLWNVIINLFELIYDCDILNVNC